MSNSKSYLRQQKYQNATLILREQSQPMKNFNKIATLEPYMADIQKRHKIKPKLTKVNKGKLNQSSSRSFRIKEVSTSSLHKLAFDRIDVKAQKLEKNKQVVNTTATIITSKKVKPLNQAQIRQRKARSQQNRNFQQSFSKKIQTKQVNNNPKDTLAKNQNQSQQINFFNDYFMRGNRAKDNKPKFRKNLYEMAIPKKNSITQDGNSQSIKKISYTQINIDKNFNKQKSREGKDIGNGRDTQVVRKNNFRRGKYQIAMHSSVNQKPQNDDRQPLQSQRLYQLDKKESNLSLNQQMDILAETQMQKFYRQVRTREIQKSLEKSTEKYFGNDSYRPVKSKNEIQLYLSSIINPSLNKISQSTYDKSDNRNESPLDLKNRTDFYAYNFDFQPQRHIAKQKIQEIENPSEEQQSCCNFNQNEFEKQRKDAQIQHFRKDTPQIQWSDDQCQIDDI